jgi:hypothetical protein
VVSCNLVCLRGAPESLVGAAQCRGGAIFEEVVVELTEGLALTKGLSALRFAATQGPGRELVVRE